MERDNYYMMIINVFLPRRRGLTKEVMIRKETAINKIVFCIQHAAVIMVSNTWCERSSSERYRFSPYGGITAVSIEEQIEMGWSTRFFWRGRQGLHGFLYVEFVG